MINKNKLIQNHKNSKIYNKNKMFSNLKEKFKSMAKKFNNK